MLVFMQLFCPGWIGIWKSWFLWREGNRRTLKNPWTRREPTKTWATLGNGAESNPGHIDGRQALSPLCQPRWQCNHTGNFHVFNVKIMAHHCVMGWCRGNQHHRCKLACCLLFLRPKPVFQLREGCQVKPWQLPDLTDWWKMCVDFKGAVGIWPVKILFWHLALKTYLGSCGKQWVADNHWYYWHFRLVGRMIQCDVILL